MTKINSEEKQQIVGGEIAIGTIVAVATLVVGIASIITNIVKCVKENQRIQSMPPAPEKINFNCYRAPSHKTLH